MAVSFQFNHSVDDVLTQMLDADFLVERSLALGEKSAECNVEGSGDQYEVTMRREMISDLPKVLAKVFNPNQTSLFTESWRRDGDGWQGDLKIEVVGQPVTIAGKFSLSRNGEGCRYEISHNVKAKIPLVGGRVEKFISSQTTGGCTDELDYLKTKLG